MSDELKAEVLSSDRKAEKEQKELQYKKMMYAINSALSLGSLNKNETKTYGKYNKSDYRRYVENPKQNEKNLRDMSQFLARASMPYKRILWYYASIPLFYWNLTPKIDPAKMPDSNKLLTQYCEMANMIERMELNKEMRNAIYCALRDGVFYGFIYEDDKNFFIHRLDPDYCKIGAIDGCFDLAFDFSYFKKFPEKLEIWDPVFKTGYNQYQKDTTTFRWQIIDPTRTICLKADPENLDENIPFFLGVFEALLDLLDARTLQRNRDVIENYKLIIQKIPIGNDATSYDDFKIEIDTAVKFFQQLVSNVPDNIGVVLSPMDMDTIDFKPDDNSNDLLAASMKSVFDDSGVSEMLFNSNKSGSVGLDASIKTDVALSFEFVKQVERWVRRYIRNRTSTIEFNFEILNVDIFNKDKVVDSELKLANSGVPNKMKLAAVSGISPAQTISAEIFENQILQIHTRWMPLQSAFTMSGSADTGDDEKGRPESEEPNDNTDINKDTEGNKDEV